MRSFQIEQIDLHYSISGKGKPLILINGLGTHNLVWSLVASDFASHYQIITFENRGIRPSTIPKEPYRIGDMAVDLKNLMDKLHISRAHILGHSMGVAIAICFATMYSDRVDRLVLCNGAKKINKVSQTALEFNAILMQLNLPYETLCRVMLPWVFSSSFLQNDQLVQLVIEMQSSTSFPITLEGYSGQLQALIQEDVTSILQNIKCPTLVMGGEKDLLVPKDEVQSLAKGIAGSIHHEFKGVAHAPQIECPKEFAEKVIEFYSL